MTDMIDKNNLLKDGAILVALLTGSFFIFTYSFQVGYCSYYNIPKELIRINGTNIAEWFKKFGTTFLYLSLFEIFISKIIHPIFKNYPRHVLLDQYFYYILFLITLFFSFLQVIIKSSLMLILVNFGMSLVPAVIMVINHIQFIRGTYITILNENYDEEKQSDFSFVKRILGGKLISSLLLLLFIVSIATSVGEASARKQQVFYQVGNRSDIIGIQFYGDYLIAKSVTDESLTYTEVISMSNDLRIMQISNDGFRELVSSFNDSQKEKDDNESVNRDNDNARYNWSVFFSVFLIFIMVFIL